MKYILLIIIICLVSACAGMGHIMQGAGRGLSASSRNSAVYNKEPMTCTTNYAGGYICQ